MAELLTSLSWLLPYASAGTGDAGSAKQARLEDVCLSHVHDYCSRRDAEIGAHALPLMLTSEAGREVLLRILTEGHAVPAIELLVTVRKVQVKHLRLPGMLHRFWAT